MGDPAAGRESRRAPGASAGSREPRRAVARLYRAKTTVGSRHGWPGAPAGGSAAGSPGGQWRGARFLRANNGTAIFAGVMAVGRDVPIAPPG